MLIAFPGLMQPGILVVCLVTIIRKCLFVIAFNFGMFVFLWHATQTSKFPTALKYIISGQ